MKGRNGEWEKGGIRKAQGAEEEAQGTELRAQRKKHRAQSTEHRAEERYTACGTRKPRDGRKVEQNGSPPAPLSGWGWVLGKAQGLRD